MEAIKDLLFRMADDALIIGHRNSEWTGIGPILEEDIAFASMAQDKIGHAQALYNILHEVFGMQDPDFLGFRRQESEFKSCHFVELPIGDYAFSTVRHFFFDHAEAIRYEMLSKSKFEPLAKLTLKFKGEIKYHILHADTWMKSLSVNGNEESRARIQSAVNELYPYALGMFEPGIDESGLIDAGYFNGEKALQARWEELVQKKFGEWSLSVPSVAEKDIKYGGRKGFHSSYLADLLNEMTEVIRTDYEAEW
jgi:ring-1,2-phenylacetyl-CoA epoxidase subunit PaaC